WTTIVQKLVTRFPSHLRSGRKREGAGFAILGRRLNDESREGPPWPPMPDLQDVEPWPEPVDGGVLLDELKSWLVLFVVLPKLAAEILALWILHTFAFLLRDTSTYIGLESPIRRC